MNEATKVGVGVAIFFAMVVVALAFMHAQLIKERQMGDRSAFSTPCQDGSCGCHALPRRRGDIGEVKK
jgi:hypothetical protein